MSPNEDSNDRASASPSGSGIGLTPASTDPPIGETIDKYKLLEVIGRSETTIVYRAKRSDGRIVALKSPVIPNPAFVSAFERCCESVLALDHSGIGKTLDLVKVRGRPFQALEFIAAVDLDELLQTQDFVEIEEEIHDLLMQIANTIEYAHGNNVVHGRLLPGHILLSERDGELCIKVLDFGFNEFYRTFEREVHGKDSRPANPKTDIYQLGVLAYFIITGKSPFDNRKLEDILLNSPTQKPELLSYHRSDLQCGDELAQLLDECLDPDEDWRLENITAFKEGLNNWLNSVHKARERTSELAKQIVDSTADGVKSSGERAKTGGVSREIKTTIRTIVKLRHNESNQSETLMMQFTDKIARAGPRRSPMATALRLVMIFAITLMVIGSVVYAMTSHNETMRKMFLSSSRSLSGIFFHRENQTDDSPDELANQILEQEKLAFETDDKPVAKNNTPVSTTGGMSAAERPEPPQWTAEQVKDFYTGSGSSVSNNAKSAKQRRHFRIDYREFNQDWLK